MENNCCNKNKVFQGESFAFEGVLKVDGVVKHNYTMTYQLITIGGKVSEEYPVSLDGDTYYGTVDTSNLLGSVAIRFIVRDSDFKVVSNQSITIDVLK